MYKIEDFNLCSSSADLEIFTNELLREALTLLINYQIEEYTYNEGLYDIDTSKLTIYLYPESKTYLVEIRDKRESPTICLCDSLTDWLQTVKEERQLFEH